MKNKKLPFPLLILLIALTCVIPVYLAKLIVFERHNLHLSQSNRGDLVVPVIDKQHLTFGKQLPTARWSLLYLTTQCCEKTCRDNLFVTHQITKSLMQKKKRLHA